MRPRFETAFGVAHDGDVAVVSVPVVGDLVRLAVVLDVDAELPE